MIRAIAHPGDIPMPDQPSVFGEFFETPLGYICAVCKQTAKLIQEPGRCGVMCVNPDCAQRNYLYDFERAWLPRAKPAPAPPAD